MALMARAAALLRLRQSQALAEAAPAQSQSVAKTSMVLASMYT